jgi:periplasmic protein TonB
MLAYAASRPAVAARRSSPNILLIVIGAHVALLAALIAAKMDLPNRIRNDPISVYPVPLSPPPPPARASADPPRHVTEFTVDQSTRPVPPVITHNLPIELRNSGVDIGQSTGPVTTPRPNPTISPARFAARLLTSPDQLKPPYPPSKLLAEEEAVLKLRLTIDAHGRVVAVEPVGDADPVFLDAARRHLLAHWRYQPATEDGQPIASTMLITLRFELDR